MSININFLTTEAHIDGALAQAEELRSDFLFHRTGTERQIENAPDISKVPKDKLIAERVLAGLQILKSQTPPGPDLTSIEALIEERQNEIENLTDKEDSYGTQAMQDREVKIGLYNMGIEEVDQYKLDLEAKKTQLSAA